MPAPLEVNREAVRTLAVAVGVREAARQMGLTESVVMQWSAREGWFKQETPKPVPPTMQKQVVSGVSSPAEALQAVLLERKETSLLGASKYVSRMMHNAGESGTLDDAPKLEKVSQIMARTWPEQQGPSVAVQVNIMDIGLD